MGLLDTAKEGFAECLAKPRQFLMLCGLAALAISSYGIARPAVESLFFSHYGKEALPWVWLCVAVAAGIVVLIYNRFAGRLAVSSLYMRIAIASAAMLGVLLVCVHMQVPHAAFVLYIWKDVYIVVLVEVFWSFANMMYPVRTARWAYGMFCACGSIGAISAELSVGFLAQTFGTAHTLLFVIPMMALVGFGATRVTRNEPALQAPKSKHAISMADGLKVLWQSKYLTPMLVLICVTQLVVTLIDYQYNSMIIERFPDETMRTNVIGKVYAAISVCALVLQLITGPLLRFVGVAGALVGIPFVLGSFVAAFALSPRFLTIAVSKVASKAFDYSIFRAGKEILYIPLSYAEKVQGKAIIDILSYRVAKGGASVLLIALTAQHIGDVVINGLNLALVGAWIVLTILIVRRYARVSRVAVPATEPATATTAA